MYGYRKDEYACVGVDHVLGEGGEVQDGWRAVCQFVRGAVERDGMLCYAMLCYAMLCYGIEFLAEKLSATMDG
ncbi:hypothetical protein BTUL_0156g00090 [Botrytis tulipae]|uniref:Uncharacterized protein n=1 Tax=Botrytis tulipae TaxID=87230 RepID=A0A4Z1EGZ1_9HELO|nr:hypothetical protein BTUL_0156g00090 [Botrytis tulipae]